MSVSQDNKGHRARLRERFLKDEGAAMADYELLELALFQAQPRADTKPMAKALLKRFGSIGAVLAASATELTSIKGVGQSAVTALKTARALGLRTARQEILDRPVLASWEKVLAYCHACHAFEKTERVHLLFLDNRSALIADEIQQTGTVDQAVLYPREVVKRTLELGASALIIVHNHPSGDPSPSLADIAITKDVIAAASPLGIAVHDHVVIGRDGHASLRALGVI